MIEAVLFDWGGTLAVVERQMEALRRGAAEVVQSLVGEPIPAVVDVLVTAAIEAEKHAAADPEHREVDLAELIRGSAGRYGVPVSEAQLAAAMAAIGRNWVGAALQVIPGVREMLLELRGRGLRIGLVSNVFIPPAYCLDELRHEHLVDLFDCTIFSSGIGYRKPSARIYEAAMQGVSPGGRRIDPACVLFVGDSPAYDVVAPAALGMKTALVAGAEGLWPQADYERAQPDLRLNSVLELAGVLSTLG